VIVYSRITEPSTENPGLCREVRSPPVVAKPEVPFGLDVPAIEARHRVEELALNGQKEGANRRARPEPASEWAGFKSAFLEIGLDDGGRPMKETLRAAYAALQDIPKFLA
jgi:hypothetical protein